jgi:hypothetical protein
MIYHKKGPETEIITSIFFNLQMLTTSMGDKLLPCLIYLAQESNEHFAAELQRSTAMLERFLYSVLSMDKENCSEESAHLVFKILIKVMPEGAAARRLELARITQSLILNAPNTIMVRLAEAIICMVSYFYDTILI